MKEKPFFQMLTVITVFSIIVSVSFTACTGRAPTQGTGGIQTVQAEPAQIGSPDLSGTAQAESIAVSSRDLSLPLSDMLIKVTSQGRETTFQLYDTVAAKELYDQLPLELNLSNFANVKWLFYPPQRLNVTSQEAFQEALKGDLTYYVPWGCVTMLYKDFVVFNPASYMHRLGIGISDTDNIENMSGVARLERFSLAN